VFIVSPGGGILSDKLTIEEQLAVLQKVVEAMIWGPHLDDPAYRRKVAFLLQVDSEAAERHQTWTPAVRSELCRLATALEGEENNPDDPGRPRLCVVPRRGDNE
jgi:hypothetical protein